MLSCGSLNLRPFVCSFTILVDLKVKILVYYVKTCNVTEYLFIITDYCDKNMNYLK